MLHCRFNKITWHVDMFCDNRTVRAVGQIIFWQCLYVEPITAFWNQVAHAVSHKQPLEEGVGEGGGWNKQSGTLKSR